MSDPPLATPPEAHSVPRFLVNPDLRTLRTARPRSSAVPRDLSRRRRASRRISTVKALDDYSPITLLLFLTIPYLVLVALLPLLARLVLLHSDHPTPDPYSAITYRGDLVTTAVAVGLVAYMVVGWFLWLFRFYPTLQLRWGARQGRGWVPRAAVYLLITLMAFLSELVTMRLLWKELGEEKLTSERRDELEKVEVGLAALAWTILVVLDVVISTCLRRVTEGSEVGSSRHCGHAT